MPKKKEPSLQDKHIGARVRMRRTLIEMSQDKLGKALGVTFQQVQKYEKGANRIAAARLSQIATILQCPLSFFYEGLPGHETTTPALVVTDLPQRFFATRLGVKLAEAFVLIDDNEGQASIVAVAEQVAAARTKAAAVARPA